MHTVSLGVGNKTILAHGGFVVGWEMWLPVFELLSKRWRCVSYDHRGVGESPVPPESITDEALIDDVFAVMDKMNYSLFFIARSTAIFEKVPGSHYQDMDFRRGQVTVGPGANQPERRHTGKLPNRQQYRQRFGKP